MPSNIDPKTIILKGDVVRKELLMKASEAIFPGHLVERDSAGTLQKHSTASGTTSSLFAVEGDADGSSISDAFADGETVPFAACPAGTEVYAILEDGHTIAIGDPLESAGDGTLQGLTASAATSQAQRNSVVATALEAVTTSGSTSRIKVEVI